MRYVILAACFLPFAALVLGGGIFALHNVGPGFWQVFLATLVVYAGAFKLGEVSADLYCWTCKRLGVRRP